MKVVRPRFIRSPLVTAVALAGLSAAVTPLAMAQQDPILEEIVVTARKVAESLQDVPIAVSAFSGDKIESLVMRDIREMEGFIPNVVIDAVSVAPGAASLYVRGVGTQEVERSFDPAVGFVVDGVSLSYVNGSMANTFDIDVMEVLRGPQGTLFGRNTTGGVINVRHSTPTGELGLKYELVAGSDDRADARAVLNFPIIEDKLAGKLGFATMQDGGQVDNKVTGDQVGDFDNTEYTATLLWTPVENFDALFIYTNYEDKNDGVPLYNRSEDTDLACIFGYCADGKVDDTNQDFYKSIDFELDAYTLEMNWELEYGTITSVSGYRDTDEKVPTDFDGTPIALLHVTRTQESDQTSSELRFASNDALSEDWDFVVGAYYLSDNYKLNQFSQIVGVLGTAPDGTGAVYQNPFTDHDRDTYSVFGELHYPFMEDFTLTLGGRWTYEEKKIHAGNFLSLGTPDNFNPIGEVRADEDWDEFTPKVGVDWRYNDDVLFYASYAEGFRSGGFNGRNYTPADIGPFDPEYVDQYEIGMKGDFLDSTLRLNMAAFYTDYSDKQEEVIQRDEFGGTLTVVSNASTVDIYGVEGEMTWIATENLVFNANFGYLDASYNDYKADLNGDGIETDNSDLELRRTPDWTGGVNATYTRGIGPGTFSIFTSYRYTDEYWVDTANNPNGGLLDDRGVLDATIAYEWEWQEGRTVKVSAFGRDITDERDYNSYVAVPGLFSFGAAAGGDQYGVQVTGNF
ncbi:MAG: TonB-dependent receptor [Halieaceae bacterium]